MILSKQWYKLGDISFAGFLRLFGTNNFSGIVHFDEFLEKEVIFVRVNIFWDTPLYLSIDFNGNLIEDTTSNQRKEEVFLAFINEGLEHLYLLDIINDYKLELKLMNSIVLFAYDIYVKSKETSIVNYFSFYKKMSYVNINCYKIHLEGSSEQLFLTRIWLYWENERSGTYLLIDTKGNIVKDIVFEKSNLSELYKALVLLNKDDQLYLSDFLSCKKIDALLWVVYDTVLAT